MNIKIEKLVYGGAGVGEMDGKIIFVPFSAPDDVLDVEITNDHLSFAEAQISKIVEGAPCRVNPPCPVFGKCGGCQWQHISYEAQLEWKRLILVETLRRIGKIDAGVLPTLPSPKQWNYRNRIQLHIDSRGRVGFYRPKSKEVIEFDHCLIADEKINERLNSMRESLKFRTKGISLRLEEGPSFLQINTEQNEQLKKVVVDWLKEVPHDSILELYAGAGNFTFSLVSIAKRIVASDIDSSAIKFAKERQKKEAAENIEFSCSSAEDSVGKFHGGCDAVLVDPPRKGCIEAIDAIVSLKPKSVLYVSCDPATLARDIKNFGEQGYKLSKSMPVDMFPQTYHIESVNLLTRS